MKLMKRLLILMYLTTTITIAQTWNGQGDGSWWFDGDNWSNNTVPDSGSNVLIPNGFTVNLTGSTGFANSIIIAGSSTLNFNSSLFLGNSFSIESNATFNCSSPINGGTITNNGTINLTDNSGLVGATLNNEGTINFLSTGDFTLINSSTLNNLSTGIIDMQTDSGNITTLSNSGTNVFNNFGLIKKTTSTGNVLINAILNNNNGIVRVESGKLTLFGQYDKSLTNGIYNVFSGATLECDLGNIIPLNTLQGTIDGTFNIKSNILVNSGTTATFNFNGNGTFNWIQNALVGGGTLINQSILNLTTSATKTIRDNTTLNNEGTLNITSTGDIIIQDGIINNQINGIIDLQADLGNINYPANTTTSHILNNYGLIKRTTTTGTALIFVETNNSGIIDIQSGELEFNGNLGFNNLTNGIVKGIATLDLPFSTNFNNEGTFAPGASPGTLTVIGDYTSTSSTVLDIELDGLVQSTEYDLLAIQGNADFNGIINIILGFDTNIGDEFIIATTTGTITNSTLPSMVSATFNSMQYEFSLTIRNNNELVLGVTNVTLSTNSNELKVSQILVFPNPASNEITLRNNSSFELISAEIIDIKGRILSNINLQDIQTDRILFLNNIEKGIYLLKIKSNKNSITKKIIKW